MGHLCTWLTNIFLYQSRAREMAFMYALNGLRGFVNIDLTLNILFLDQSSTKQLLSSFSLLFGEGRCLLVHYRSLNIDSLCQTKVVD